MIAIGIEISLGLTGLLRQNLNNTQPLYVTQCLSHAAVVVLAVGFEDAALNINFKFANGHRKKFSEIANCTKNRSLPIACLQWLFNLLDLHSQVYVVGATTQINWQFEHFLLPKVLPVSILLCLKLFIFQRVRRFGGGGSLERTALRLRISLSGKFTGNLKDGAPALVQLVSGNVELSRPRPSRLDRRTGNREMGTGSRYRMISEEVCRGRPGLNQWNKLRRTYSHECRGTGFRFDSSIKKTVLLTQCTQDDVPAMPPHNIASGTLASSASTGLAIFFASSGKPMATS